MGHVRETWRGATAATRDSALAYMEGHNVRGGRLLPVDLVVMPLAPLVTARCRGIGKTGARQVLKWAPLNLIVKPRGLTAP